MEQYNLQYPHPASCHSYPEGACTGTLQQWHKVNYTQCGVCREASVPCVELSRAGAEADAAIAELEGRGLLRAAFVKDAVRRRVRVYVQHCFSGREWCQPSRHRADEVHLIG